MCLDVDFDVEIYDDQVYTFYKVYIKERRSKRSPYGLYSPYQYVSLNSYNLVAKAGKRAMPEAGQEAYDIYAQEYWRLTNEKYPYSAQVHYGIHAYTSVERARKMRFGDAKIAKVEVLGKHIMAFSKPAQGEVAFTRGTIVGYACHESKCLDMGYPKAKTSVFLKGYCYSPYSNMLGDKEPKVMEVK